MSDVQSGKVPEMSKHNERGSKENGLPECRNEEFIFTKTHLLAFPSKKLRGLKYGL